MEPLFLLKRSHRLLTKLFFTQTFSQRPNSTKAKEHKVLITGR